ncbi:MAG TPA: hypothetical protein ACFYEK_09100 [Candidatus Wunengus sp. YC60]|uniref:hypothetical protein n=1 Tax=Candidatus Wunengus sp. YC60 TaxID=3367697 RepID=UPI00402512E0
MSTISTIEDKLISTIRNTGLFKLVDSQGRNKRPEVINYPAAFVYFSSDRDTGVRPRPVIELIYEIQIVNKNVQTEGKAAKDTYTLLDGVRDAINFKSLGITDIEPFTLVARNIKDYQDGIITYLLQFKTRHYLAVPVDT